MSLIVSLLVLAGVIAYFLAGATLKPKWESEYKQRMEDFDCGLSTFLNMKNNELMKLVVVFPKQLTSLGISYM